MKKSRPKEKPPQEEDSKATKTAKRSPIKKSVDLAPVSRFCYYTIGDL